MTCACALLLGRIASGCCWPGDNSGAQMAHPSAGPGAPERAGHRDHQGLARPRHHRAVRLGGALRRSAAAAFADGRCSGAFTPEATVTARHANTPEWSVRCLRHNAHVGHPRASGRGGRQWAAGAGTGRRHRARKGREVELASGPATGSRSGTNRRSRTRWTSRPPSGCAPALSSPCCRALRPCAVAARTDGRYSGGFTPEATGAARHANAPELSVW